jgi:hypothetical protein
MELGIVRERVRGLVIPKNQAIELPVVRTTEVTSGEVYNAVILNKLGNCLRHPEKHPEIEYINLGDDSVKPGESILSLLGLRKGKKSK